MIYKIQVDGIPDGPNKIGQMHWAKKNTHKREWTEKVGWLARSVNRPKVPFEKAHIHFKINFGNNQRHDPDNANFAVSKPSLDALVGVFIQDDSIDNIELSYEYTREKPRGFEITITEIKENNNE